MAEDASLLRLLAIEGMGTPEEEIPKIPSKTDLEMDYPYG